MARKLTFLPLTVLLFSLKLFGLAPFTVNFNRSTQTEDDSFPEFHYSTYGKYYSAFILFGIISIQSWTFASSFTSSFVSSSVDRQIESVTFLVSSTIAVVTVVASHIHYQNTMVKMGNDIIKVDESLMMFNYYYNVQKENKYIIGTIIFCAFVLGSFLFIENKAYESDAWWGSAVVHYIFGIFMIEYVLILEIIIERFRTINFCMRSLQTSEDYQSEVNEDFYKIKTLRNSHWILCQSVRTVADIYGLPVLFTLGYCFLTNLISFYFITVTVLEGSFKVTRDLVIDESIWICVVMVPIILMSQYVTNCKKEGITITADTLHDLEIRTNKMQNLSVIKEFSLYLRHINLDATAVGLFPLDGTLIHSIFSAMASYLIILLQFHEASEDDEEEETNEVKS